MKTLDKELKRDDYEPYRTTEPLGVWFKRPDDIATFLYRLVFDMGEPAAWLEKETHRKQYRSPSRKRVSIPVQACRVESGSAAKTATVGDDNEANNMERPLHPEPKTNIAGDDLYWIDVEDSSSSDSVEKGPIVALNANARNRQVRPPPRSISRGSKERTIEPTKTLARLLRHWTSLKPEPLIITQLVLVMIAPQRRKSKENW